MSCPDGNCLALSPRITDLNGLEGTMKHLALSHRKLGFNVHAFAFVATMILLLAINLGKGPP